MNKKIKIIELLNKIANEEEVPERIAIDSREYLWCKNSYYKNDEGYYLFEVFADVNIKGFLNKEVEIIGKQQDIDIQDIEEMTYKGEEIGYGTTEEFTDDIGNYCSAINSILDSIGIKINQVIKAVKKLDKDINYIDN